MAQAVQAGQVLVELDRAQASADLAAASADFVESESQVNRSRDLVATQVVSKSQFEQLEATMKANAGARGGCAGAPFGHLHPRAVFRPCGIAPREPRRADQPGHGDHHAG